MLALICVVVLLSAPGVRAAEEPLRTAVLPSPAVEHEVTPGLGFEAPPAPYPLKPVDQLPFRGARHGLVTTTTGALVFRVPELHLPGRMPLDFGRVYDSAISDALPPPPPNQEIEPRWTHDLGKNWILGYGAYLVPVSGGVLMATEDGDLLRWVQDPGGSFHRQFDCPTRHMSLQKDGSTKIIETQWDGTKWTYTWTVNSAGSAYFLTKVEDRSGNTVTLTYTQGYLSRIENSDGASIDILRPMFDPNYPSTIFPRTRVVRVTDNTGRFVIYDYDSDGLLTSATDPLGHVWTYAYESNEKLISATDPLGNTYLTASYDTQNRVSTCNADAGPWTFTYISATQATDGLGNTWTYTANPTTGITIQIQEPTGAIHHLTIDSANNPVQYEDPTGAAAHWTYDANHRPLTYTPAGSTANITYVYDATNGWVNSITGQDGGVTAFTRDSHGRVVTEVDAGGGHWTATYNSQGDRVTLRLPLGNDPGPSGYLWSFTYDTYGNRASATDPTGRVFEWEYTPQGDLSTFRRPDHEDPETHQIVKAEWAQSHDVLGRLTSSTDPLGNTWTRTYDVAGRLTGVEGPECLMTHSETHYVYDAHYRLTDVVVVKDGVNDPTTHFTYDAAGRLASKTTPTGSTWIYVYDGSSRLIGLTDPLGRTWAYSRDANGRLNSLTFPGAGIVTLARDTAGRLIGREYPGGRVETFEYDVAGRLSAAEATTGEDWTGRIEWDHDFLGRPTRLLTSTTTPSQGFSRELLFTYDLNGNRIHLAASDEEAVDYTYDELDRLVATTSTTRGSWQAFYDPISGHRTKVTWGTPPDREEDWGYDVAGQLVYHKLLAPDLTEEQELTLDAEGRIVTEYDIPAETTRDLTYGPEGWIDQETRNEAGTVTTSTFSYDPEGHLLESAKTVGEGEPEVTSFSWDAAGRITWAGLGKHTRTYTWEDAPGDPAVAMRVWRASNDYSEKTLQVDYGYDGRLSLVVGHHVDLPAPAVLMKNVWAPLDGDIALEVTEGSDDGTSEMRRMDLEVGGYYAEEAATAGVQRLVSPVGIIDSARGVLTPAAGSIAPNAETAFRLGRWEPRQDGGKRQGPALDAPSSGLAAARDAIRNALAAEGRPRVRLALLPPVRPSAADFRDDWLNEVLLPSGREGGNALANGAVAVRVGSAEGSVDPNSCPVWYCVNKETPGAVQINVCSGPDLLEYGPTWQDCVIWVRASRGGNPLPDVPDMPRAQELGFPEPFRYPEYTPEGVSLRNGEFALSVTDVEVFDQYGPIRFTRAYRSNVGRRGVLGWRWFHNWEESLEICSDCTPEQVRWIEPNAQTMDFYWVNGRGYVGPNDSTYRLRWEPDGYELRSVAGEVRKFDSQGQLLSITKGASQITLEYEQGRLTSVKSSGLERLHFEYNAPSYSLLRVTGGSQSVEFGAGSCNELETVTRQPEDLGWDRNGSPSSSLVPQTKYYYQNPSPIGNACSEGGADTHKLIQIVERQFNPLTPSESWETTVVNRYHRDEAGAGSPEYMKVKGQCFGKEPSDCPVGQEDLRYTYTWIAKYPGKVTIADRRVNGNPIMKEENFDSENGDLLEVIDDASGMQKRTNYVFIDSLLRKVTYPDRICTTYNYAKVGGAYLVEEERDQTKTACEGGTGGPSDRVTRYTYEDVTGRLRTVTRPEAFPDGVVPADFDPLGSPKNRYTTHYFYDLNQTAPGQNYPGELLSTCQEWGLTCPEKLGDKNDFSGDDGRWFGNLVRVERVNPDGTSLVETYVSQPSGRPTKRVAADGVSTEYSYYTAPEYSPSAWTWESGTTSQSGEGPLASVTVPPKGESTKPALVTRYVWSSAARLIGKADPAGRYTERAFSASGRILTEDVCAVGAAASCASGSAELRTTRNSFDLRGRLVRSAVYPQHSSANPVAVVWTTYDTLGRPTTRTVDPNPAATPGEIDPDPNAGYLHLLSKTFYDGRGRVTKEVSPAGRAECSTYDELDRRTRVTRHNLPDTGNSNCPQSAPGDLTTQVAYNIDDQPCKFTDGRGISTYQGYDAWGAPTLVSDGKPTPDPYTLTCWATAPPLTWYSETTHDPLSGLAVRERFWGSDGNNHSGFLKTSWFEYDNLRRPTNVHVVLAPDRVVDGYHVSGVVPEGTANLTTAPQDNPQNEDLRIAKAETQYANDGKVEYRIDAGGRSTKLVYDDFGRPQKTLAPAVSGNRDQIEIAYDDVGRPFELTRTEYGPKGETQAHTEVSRREYDAWGRVIRTSGDPGTASELDRNLITTYERDALDRVTTEAKRWTIATSYSEYNPSDRVTKVSYDKAGRVTESQRRFVVDPDEHWATTTYGYDADGLVTSLTDARGNTTNWQYKTNGLLFKMLYPPLSQGGPRQKVEISSHDGNGNPVEIRYWESDSEGSRWLQLAQEYDNRNHLTSREASLEPDGYSPEEFFGTTKQEFRWDDLGRMVKAIDRSPSLPSGEQDIVDNFAYDTGGRVNREDQALPLNGNLRTHPVDSTYLLDGFRSTLSYPTIWVNWDRGETLDRYKLSMSPDAEGRLAQIVGPDTPVEPAFGVSRSTTILANYQHLGGKVWSRWYQNDTETRFYKDEEMLYDQLGRVRGMRTVDVQDPDPDSSITDFRYGYDRVGNLSYEQRRHEPLGDPSLAQYRTRTYRVDRLDRLTKWREGGLGTDNPVPPDTVDPTDVTVLPSPSDGEEWNLDLLGNWISHSKGTTPPAAETFLANPLNQYTQVDPDGDGPQVAKPFRNDWVGQLRDDDTRSHRRYVWDCFGRLTQVKEFDPNTQQSTLIATYRYDAMNRRVERKVEAASGQPVERLRFFYDGWRAIEERVVQVQGDPPTESEQLRARYGYGLGLDEVLWMDRDGSVGVPDGVIESRFYLHQDALGSVTAATAADRSNGLVTAERFTYSAYGEVTAWNGDWSLTGTYLGNPASVSRIGLPYLYTGQRLDPETGLYYYKNRYYHPANGRFLSRDPLGCSAGPGLYEYAGSNAATATDPLGLEWGDESSRLQRQVSLARGRGNSFGMASYHTEVGTHTIAYEHKVSIPDLGLTYSTFHSTDENHSSGAATGEKSSASRDFGPSDYWDGNPESLLVKGSTDGGRIQVELKATYDEKTKRTTYHFEVKDHPKRLGCFLDAAPAGHQAIQPVAGDNPLFIGMVDDVIALAMRDARMKKMVNNVQNSACTYLIKETDSSTAQFVWNQTDDTEGKGATIYWNPELGVRAMINELSHAEDYATRSFDPYMAEPGSNQLISVSEAKAARMVNHYGLATEESNFQFELFDGLYSRPIPNPFAEPRDPW